MIKAASQIISIITVLSLIFGNYVNVQAAGASAATLAGTTYYVAVNGSDVNACTSNAPCKTFSRAVTLAQAGDSISIQPGSYTETLSVSKSDLTILGNGAVIDAVNKSHGVALTGKNLTLLGIVVKNSTSHGIKVTGQNIRVANSEIYNSVLECVSVESTCGSALKVGMLADGIIFENNYIHNNKSEGIAITTGKNVVIRNNRVTNNAYVEIYVDNSLNVRVENNHVFCNQPGSTGIAFDEEYYAGWGQQLYNLYIGRNIVTGCSSGLGYWGSQGGIKTGLIEYNTFHNLREFALYFAAGANSNVQIRRNIFPNIKPWFDDKTGINMDDNFWVTTKPGSQSGASGSNDKAGSPQYAVPPVWDSPETFKQVLSSPACGYGRWDCPTIPAPTLTPITMSATPVIPTATRTTAPTLSSPTATMAATNTPMATFTSAPSSTPVRPTFTSLPSFTPVQPTFTSTAIQPTATIVSSSDAMYDNTSNIFAYSTNWQEVPDPQAWGNSYKLTGERDNTISFTFIGQSFSILFTQGPELRNMAVYVDGKLMATISQRNSVKKYQQRWDYPYLLTDDTHTVQLVAKNKTNTFVSFDGVIFP